MISGQSFCSLVSRTDSFFITLVCSFYLEHDQTVDVIVFLVCDTVGMAIKFPRLMYLRRSPLCGS